MSDVDQAPESDEPRTFSILRASDPKQTESCDTQREIVDLLCKSLGLPPVTHLEEPPGTSGYKTRFAQRPMGLWVLRNLRKGDTLIALRIDRMGRNMIDCYQTIDTLFARGVRVIIVKGWSGSVIDMRDPNSRLLLAILAWCAENEARSISERTKEGLHHRRVNGLSAGRRAFTYIQSYDATGAEISTAEYDKTKGHYKLNLPDTQWLDQICQLLSLQKHLRARGKFLLEYCRERNFVNHAGKQWWWTGTLHANGSGTNPNRISQALKKARRMAVLGQLPEGYNERVLAITGDTPIDVVAIPRPSTKRKRASQVDATVEDRESWTAEQWLEEYRKARGDSNEC